MLQYKTNKVNVVIFVWGKSVDVVDFYSNRPENKKIKIVLKIKSILKYFKETS